MAPSNPESNVESIDDLLDRLAEAESRLVRLTTEVDHLQRLAMVGTLAAGVVHEINNQLTPALAQAQMARLRPDEQKTLLAALDRCIEGITRAGRIGETLVGFASPCEAETSPSLGVCDTSQSAANIAVALKTTLALLGNAPTRAGIMLNLSVPPGAWARIEPLALQQVLLNLLLNAIKALHDTREPNIRVSATKADDGRLEVAIEDNGPGIAPSVRETLFKPFASAAVTKRTGKGTGLGLAVSERLIKAAGGSIEAGESESGGARFTLRLYSISSASRAKSG